MASTSNIRTPPATRPSLFVQTATPRGLGLATNTSRSFGGGGASPSSAISTSTRGTPQTPFQQQQQQQQKSDAVYAALDGLFDVATQHYGHSGVDEFMLRSLVEATLPMAPQNAKDALRRSLAQPSRGGGVGVFNRADFCKALYGLFTNDYTTTAAEFTERIAAEHRRLSEGLRRAGEGLGLGVGVEGHPSSGRLNFTPEDLETIAKINANTRYPPNGPPTHTIPSSLAMGAAATASTAMGSAPPSITSPPSAALGAATAAGSPAPADGLAPLNPPPMAVPKEAQANGPHPPVVPLPNVPLSAAEMRRDFLSIDEMEAEIRRLREKCGEAPSAASGVVNPPPAAASLLPTTTANDVAPQSAAVMVGADGTAVPVANAAAPTQPPAAAARATAGVEAAGAEEGPFDASSAALAIGRLQAEREQTALALAAANERLHAYGRFYDRRGGAVHNARLIDAAAREARRHQQQPQPFDFPSASSNYANSGAASASAGMYPHFSNTFDPVTFSAASPQRGEAMGGDQRSPQAITRPFAGFTPQRGAMTADEVMSMLLSASPSGTSAATNPPQGLHSPNASAFYGQLQHQRPRDGSLVSTIGNSSVLSQQQQQQSQHFSPRHNLNISAGACGYGNSYGAPSQSPSALPSVDYSAVSVALPSSNLAPSSDTLLAATVPIDADDARRLLLAGPSPHAAGGGGAASLHSPLRSGGGAAGYAHAGNSQSIYGAGLNKSGLGTSVTPSAPFSAPNAPSRLDGMYHMLALEREETNRWRAYGTPHQSRFF